MENKKVLICSVSAWNKTSGSDTFSSLMEGYGADRVANIYIREDLPDSPTCDHYFRISENAVIRSIFKRRLKTGQPVTAQAQQDDNEANAKVTAQRYKKYSAKRNYLLLYAREILWKLGRWKTPELDRFIDEFRPDVVFFAMEGYIHLNRISRYVIKRSGAKGVGYFWDDNFTYRQSRKLGHVLYRFFQRKDLKKTAKRCSDFFAISPKTKQEADAVFRIDCKLLTKPVEMPKEGFVPYTPGDPIKMLYTGKLIIGRYDTVKLIGDALDELNRDSVKIELDVYTTTQLTNQQLTALSPYVHMCGAIPQTLVAEKQKAADVLLFAEALSGENSKTARLSFSTKLTDYFRSGKCIFAVGNGETAPMEYLKNEDAAITAENAEEILSALRRMVSDLEVINQYAQKALDCGKRNHDAKQIRETLFDVLNG